MARRRALILALSLLPTAALAVPSICESADDGVWVVRDDTGLWGGDLSNSITHQSAPGYEAKKVLDLTDLPQAVWDAARSVRLSVHFMVRDYSWHDTPPANGLDEAFEIIVNGNVHRYPTNCGAPVYKENGQPAAGWYDFEMPKGEFTRGANEIIIRKTGDKHDDYVYLSIDNSQKRGNSYVAFDGKQWVQDRLTIPGGNGEYMVRLYLLTEDLQTRAAWHPGAAKPVDDPAGLILYAGARDASPTADGLKLTPGQSARVEWDPAAFDDLQPIHVSIDADAPLRVAWLDEAGKPVSPAPVETPAKLTQPVGRTMHPSGVQVSATDQPVTLRAVELSAGRSLRPREQPVDMCPTIAQPAGTAQNREPSCNQEAGDILLQTTGLRCRFSAGDRLRLTSLYNEYLDREMVTSPESIFLFLVEVDDKRYAAGRDFTCDQVRLDGAAGFTADLSLPQPALKASFSARVEPEGLRIAMSLTNPGDQPVAFKLAFPHLGGLTASDRPETDYYFFPWGGGIISHRPAAIRRGYGDHEALYQVMDLFSPQRGAGLYVRADDAEGWHKTIALRKHIGGQGEAGATGPGADTAPEYKWTASLEPVEGTGFAYEYARRTREPGKDFRPAEAVLAAHTGDWHTAMRAYADWAHRVWQFRPFPSRLRTVHNMMAFGWGQDVLFKDGRYRTDFIKPNTDCSELMSWWEWSPLGPWSTPFDKLKDVLTEGQIKDWEPYFVKDPVTGQMMWNNQPGDYDGYNERFGGLPAFRKAVDTYKQTGTLVTLYTDPLRMDDASKIGQAHGKDWGVVRHNGEHSKAYEVWNPCHDVAAYRQWVADTMRRVMVETGADGIRLDEYGHRGWACFSKLHEHTFQETGASQWNKCLAETCRMVRQAMDEVAPGSVLTTEHPGYDYLMQYLEGCITYDLTVQATPMRPLECNLQRFYFPECKAYELDHRGADLESRKKIWNAVESFGRYYPPLMYLLLKQNGDVYEIGRSEPLIPTIARRVYVNRFTGGGKTMLHLYNATGHTFEGPVLPLNLQPDEHVFDMLNLREVALTGGADDRALSLYMPNGEVVVLAKLPRRLNVAREGQTLSVVLPATPADSRLVVMDAEGNELIAVPAAEGVNELMLPEGKPACVKLLCGENLIDITTMPDE